MKVEKSGLGKESLSSSGTCSRCKGKFGTPTNHVTSVDENRLLLLKLGRTSPQTSRQPESHRGNNWS